MPKVLIAPAPLAQHRGEYYQVLRDAGFEFVFPSRPVQMVEAELLDVLPRVDAALAGSEPYTARVIAACPNLKVIARAGVGYDAVDVPAATQQGTVVTFTPGTNQDAVAEHTFALILALAKNVVSQHDGIRQGEWPRKANKPLRGTVLSLIGLGRIGKATALRGLAFGMKVIACETHPDRAFCETHGIELVTLEEAFRRGDWVSIHAPLTPISRHLVCAKTLELMKPTAAIINTARGGLVNEDDLYLWLKEKRIAGAGLDVFDLEPPGPNPITHLDNVVMTAHTAGVDAQSLEDMSTCAARAIAALFTGEWPEQWIVNPEAKAKFKW